MENTSREDLLYGELTARLRRMLEPVAHDSFLFFQDTIELLSSEVSAEPKVLDAGCGRGTITAWLAERGCSVVAIDSNTDRIEHTRALLREKHLTDRVALEVSKLPDAFPSDHFDIILDCFSWWHISDWGRLLTLCKKNLRPKGRVVILDTFFGWKTTLEFRQEMREKWQTALPTFNECRNMLIKRELRLVRCDSIQQAYIKYLDALWSQLHEIEKEDLGTLDPLELTEVKSMLQWFREAAHKEELAATCMVAELTEV
jgi:cyclopropane fatty-acyl-phospholipid synthase-like methyltransferase